MSTVDITLKEAAESLTVAEVRTIEKHFGTPMEDGISGTDLQVAAVWAFERRRCLSTDEKLPNWSAFDHWTVKQLNDYFAKSEPDVPEELTDEGKDD